MLLYSKSTSIVYSHLSTFGRHFCSYLVDTFDNGLLLNRLLKHRNIIYSQCFLGSQECGHMRNGGVENLIAILAAATKLTAEPRYATTLLFQVGLNLMSYMYLHRKGVNYPL